MIFLLIRLRISWVPASGAIVKPVRLTRLIWAIISGEIVPTRRLGRLRAIPSGTSLSIKGGKSPSRVW